MVRRLYGRLLDSVAATWAVGLILSQGMLILTGPSMQGVSSPFGSFSVGQTSYSTYRVVLGVIAVVLLVLLYLVFMKTKYRFARPRHHPESVDCPGVGCEHGPDVYPDLRAR